MKVKDVMRHRVALADKSFSVLDAARIMSMRDMNSVFSVRKDRIHLLTERDIIRKVVALDKDPGLTSIEEVTTECPEYIDSEADILEASDIFERRGISSMPVVESGRPVGLLESRDVSDRIAYLSARRILGYGRECGYL